MFATKPKRRSIHKPNFEKVVIVTRMTQLEELLARFNTTAQARFYLQHAGEPFEPIEQAHAQYHQVLDQVRALVPRGITCIVIERGLLPQFHFEASDLVVAVGQDGLVVNIAKYLHHQPILAINPLPDTFDGVLLPFNRFTIGRGMENTLYHDYLTKKISMAETELNDGQKLLAFNDFFIGANSHVSARYEIQSGKQHEMHSSSGIIVSTGAGSSGWLQSVYSGAAGVVKALGGHVVPPPDHGRFDWEAEQLVYAVREPFPSKHSQASMVYGTITTSRPLILHSHMAEHGVIFSDGVEQDYVAFNTGTTATIRVARKKTLLVAAKLA